MMPIDAHVLYTYMHACRVDHHHEDSLLSVC